MKKFFVTLALAVAVVSISFASDVVKVDRKIQTAFQKEFSSAFNPSWEVLAEGLYHVSFSQNGESMDAYYNEQGQQVAFARSVSKDNLPLLVGKSIDQKFRGSIVTDIRELVGENETSYLVTARNEKATTIARIYTGGGFELVKRVKNGK
jgi:hypothetical protein